MPVAKRMSWLLAVIVLALAGWSAWWWLGASAQQAAVEGWLAERAQAGWVAEGEVSVAGYPNRIDLTLEGLVLSDPPAGWAWTAPVFRTYMLSYRPDQVIAAWPGAHVLATPEARVTAEAETLQASAGFLPSTTLEIDRAVLEAETLELSGEGLGSWTAGLARGQLSLRRAEEERGRENAYDIVLDGAGLRPPEALTALFSDAAGEGLPAAVEEVSLDATAAFARPLDRVALEKSDFRPEMIRLRRSIIRWGPLRIVGSGRVEIDAEGVPEGEIALEIREWRALLAAARSTGALDGGAAAALETGLGLIAAFSGQNGALEAPLRFSGGQTWLGPIPIGPSPRF
ncbi:MAG: DUF2125 domain-containing protein [Pseudomonadota bacterium]